METVCLWIILISGLAGMGYVVPTSVDSFSPILEDDARGDCQLDPDSICPLGYLQEIRSRLTCNFDGRQADPSPPGPAAFRLLPVCHEGPVVNGAPWINAAYYKYQFERTDKKGQANEVQNGAAAVISKCLRNNINYNNPTSASLLIDPVQATASFQTGTTVSDGSCTKFHLSFWCRLHGVIKVADKTDPNRFYLEVRVHRLTTSGLFEKDGRLIWGNATDYASFESDSWIEIRRSFFESETFSIVFFAHHNNNCSAFVQTIGLDEVQTLADKKECLTTPAPTTETPTTNLPTTDPLTSNTPTSSTPTSSTPTTSPSTSTTPRVPTRRTAQTTIHTRR
ncbi:hypothetical protein BV898_16019 [Hypsibius exemplaris]|uniref:MAM domain-containing protein n=1 Tax=Hypsibius exemplaris TaxID=2072580 RepID=A0A9X6NCC7_HYPEX|nr:hypothetical protein BV898_16019 [Hypsibius exemplaris]